MRNNTVIVYRLERDGIGPFVSREMRYSLRTLNPKTLARLEMVRLQYGSAMSRSLVGDNSIRAHGSKQYMFGCPSKSMLKAYFGKSLKKLFAQGYRIKRYNVPDSEIIDMGTELAFPVKYHKLKTVKKVKSLTKSFAL